MSQPNNAPNILIAVPAYGGSIKSACAQSLIALSQRLDASGIKYSIQMICETDIELVRNIYASLAIQNRFTHLLFIDSDMQFAPTAIGKLLKLNVPVAGCACPKRTLNLDAALDAAKTMANDHAMAKAYSFALRRTKETSGQGSASETIMKVDGIGMSVTLIKSSALNELLKTGKIRTQISHSLSGFNLTGPLYGFFDKILDNDPPLSEDFSFCHRWRKLCGGDVIAITDEMIGHIGDFNYQSQFSTHLR